VTDKLIDAALEYLKQNPQSRIDKIYFLAYTEQDRELCRHKFIHDPRVGASGETEIIPS
jgi:hypothetical protein